MLAQLVLSNLACSRFVRSASLLARPISEEKRRLLEQRYAELPEKLRVPWQVVGQQLVHCGYTMAAPYCSFGCTHCYLPRNANRAPLPSLADMQAQIDENRSLLGPDGALQITGGDVVDAYLRAGKPQELVEVVRYAAERRLVPMLMTHGQGLLDHPNLLVDLVARGHLRRLALHVDMTQAGRPGHAIGTLQREADLDPVRRAFVDLLLRVRRITGKAISAAHTVTVTERNRDSLGDILRFMIDDPSHLRVFKMVSFQTEADVGRTRFSQRPVTPADTWQALEGAIGRALPRGGMYWFGHPSCSSLVPLMVLFPERRVIPLVGDDEASRTLAGEILATFGGLGSRGTSRLEALAQRVGLLLRRPQFIVALARYARRRLREERLGGSLLSKLLRGRVGFFTVVLHNFMSAEQVRNPDAEVAARLRACSFRGAVRRPDGKVEAVPMCSMNALEREQLYESAITSEGVADLPQSGEVSPRSTALG